MMIARALLALGLCALLSGCLMLNDVRPVDTTERFEAKDREGLVLFEISRDASYVPTDPKHFGLFLLFTQEDPKTGAMIGDCFRWDHFRANSDFRSDKAPKYFLVRMPVATYSIRDFDHNVFWHFTIRAGVVNYLGNFIETGSEKVEIRADVDQAREPLGKYPSINAAIQLVELLPGGHGGFLMCTP